MDKQQVDLLQRELERGGVYFDWDVDNVDRWIIRLDNSEPMFCDRITLLTMTFVAPLSEDYASVDMLHLVDSSAMLVIFDNSSQMGQGEIMGIRQGRTRSKAFVEKAFIDWTRRQNFCWPIDVIIDEPDLISLDVVRNAN